MRRRNIRQLTPARHRWSLAVTRVAVVAIGTLGVGLATPAQAAADTAPLPGSTLSHLASKTLASTTPDEAVSDLAAPSAPSSFWVVPSLLSAVVIIVGLIFRQRERARDRTRDGTRDG